MSGRVLICAVLMVLCLACIMDVGYGQSAPMVVKNNTPTPNAESIEMAEILTKAHQVEEEISTREVLVEVESSTPERDGADTMPEFRTMNDLLAWSVNATVGHNGTVNLGNMAASMNAASLDDLLDVSAESVSAVEIMRATLSTLWDVQKVVNGNLNIRLFAPHTRTPFFPLPTSDASAQSRHGAGR
mmetsp:Transcript_21905/g.89103  ORF Transcript_21905/g.89103 Transcript_21905/m.89103 type:complete len:187 (+) Transcript_21905:225-785(+)